MHNVEMTTVTGERFAACVGVSAPGPMPAIVILQEIFGVNGFVRGVVEWLAGEGFGAIAPDLFWRQQPGIELDPNSEADHARAYELMTGLNTDAAIEDIVSVAAWARTQLWCNGKVGAVGYCLGGKLAFLSAETTDLNAAVSYYGVGIHGLLDQVPRVRAPVLLHLAEGDQLCPPAAQKQIKEAVASAKVEVQVASYPNVGHAFARPGNPGYAPAETDLANKATLKFLRDKLST